MSRSALLSLGFAALLGVGLRPVVALDSNAALAWFVPGLLLALALRHGAGRASLLVALAAAIGASVNVPDLARMLPPIAVGVVLALQTGVWVLVYAATHRIALAFGSAWTMLAFPVVWVALDTLLAHGTPDGNVLSLAYTQADVLPIAQLAALGGSGAVLFVLAVVNAALALALHARGRTAVLACTIAAAAFASTWTHGVLRLRSQPPGQPIAVGVAAIDAYLPEASAEEAAAVWRRYAELVAELRARGAGVVVLPEKIDVVTEREAQARAERLGEIARTERIALVAGFEVRGEEQSRNEAWWLAPDGALRARYVKHHLAPPERELTPGNDFFVDTLGEHRAGLAICKDMHFADFARELGARGAALVLVPAWDFVADARLAERVTRLRGIESGFAIARASRDGLLSVTDARGRLHALAESRAMPGASALASFDLAPREPTLYARSGDVLGWVCVAAALALVPWSIARGRRRVTAPTSRANRSTG